MEAISVKEMQDLDRWVIETIGIPQAVLMENAGKAVSDTIQTEIHPLNQIVVVAYKGNNGGDGLVAARYLHNAGLKVKVYLLCAKSSVTGVSSSNLAILEKLSVEIVEVIFDEELKILQRELKASDVVIDAILGIGLKGEPQGIPAAAIKMINSNKNATIVSVDIPSGINGDTGEGKIAVQADITVTFHAPKQGMLKPKALSRVGKLFIVDIGIPPKKISSKGVICPDLNLIASLIPKRKTDSHKGDFGRVFVIAGSSEMPGAAALVANSALRTGAGLVKVVVPKSIRDLVFSLGPEVMVSGVTETKEGTLALSALEKIKERLNWATVLAIGPGLSQNKETQKLVFALLVLVANKHKKLRLVIDADALNIIASRPVILSKLKNRVVVTPHPGEMARLVKLSSQAIQEDRLKAAQKLAVEYGINVVLKGANTVIAEKGKATCINLTGNPGMATAGAGDVLTGMIAAFLAQGLGLYDAALVSVYCHGLAGDLVAQLKGKRGIKASDIVESIPYVLRFVRS
ncbi:MAG: NAD(P)H-hydrate dehydratase [Candidatus Saganbacteria bacterium]|nr:NAD(P)H-hydrate dehydratase [Candidatus Saganbacteria bacterium]